jgi:Na+-driven multidrug efflux pump
MSELPALPRDQRKIDADHLKLLAIFHFIGAGLAVLGILFLLAHYLMFHAFFTNPKMWENQKQAMPPAEIFAVLKWFYLVVGIWFVTSGVLNLISGWCLCARKHRTFSMVVAGINCLHIPLGTVLGVFTIVVLVRDSVRELYEAECPADAGEKHRLLR